MFPGMGKTAPNETAGGFTAGEREYIRRELDMFFSTLPSVADGFQLKTWRGGPLAKQPKVPPVARGLIDRGLSALAPLNKFEWVRYADVQAASMILSAMTAR